MNGFETAIALLSQYPQIKILAIPSVLEEYVVARMLKIGIKSIVSKDKGLAELMVAITLMEKCGWYMETEMSMKCMSGYFKKLMLTDREERYLENNAKGLCVKQIASEMDITRSSVDKYRRKVCRKLRILSRKDLTEYASRLGLSSAAVG